MAEENCQQQHELMLCDGVISGKLEMGVSGYDAMEAPLPPGSMSTRRIMRCGDDGVDNYNGHRVLRMECNDTRRKGPVVGLVCSSHSEYGG